MSENQDAPREELMQLKLIKCKHHDCLHNEGWRCNAQYRQGFKCYKPMPYPDAKQWANRLWLNTSE